MPDTLYGPEGIKKIKIRAKNWEWSSWEMLSKAGKPQPQAPDQPEPWVMDQSHTVHVNVWTGLIQASGIELVHPQSLHISAANAF